MINKESDIFDFPVPILKIDGHPKYRMLTDKGGFTKNTLEKDIRNVFYHSAALRNIGGYWMKNRNASDHE